MSLKWFLVPALLLSFAHSAFASYSVPFNERGWDKYSGMLVNVAKRTPDVSALELTTILSLETNFGKYMHNPSNPTVGGLFHFTNGTWREMLREYGHKYGLSRNTPKTNQRANTLMAAELVRKNKQILRARLKRNVTLSEVYMAHLIGVNAASKILSSRDNRIAARLVRAGGNKKFFYARGRARTVAQFKVYLKEYVERHASTYRADVIALVQRDTTYEIAMR